MKRALALAGIFVLPVALVAGGQESKAPVDLKDGDMAPAFSLQGSDGKIHQSSDYAGKTVVLAWFPKAFTGG